MNEKKREILDQKKYAIKIMVRNGIEPGRFVDLIFDYIDIRLDEFEEEPRKVIQPLFGIDGRGIYETAGGGRVHITGKVNPDSPDTWGGQLILYRGYFLHKHLERDNMMYWHPNGRTFKDYSPSVHLVKKISSDEGDYEKDR